MKFIIVFVFAIVASSLAGPVDNSKTTILRYENENLGLDRYNFNFATSDGTSRSEQAELKTLGPDQHALQVRGSVEWEVEGVKYQLNYVADENGFRPEGAHLPKV